MNDFLKILAGRGTIYEELTPEEQAARDEEIKRLEMEQLAAERLERFKKSGVPERYFAESLDTYRTDTEAQKTAAGAARAFLRDIMQRQFKTLVLIGSAGVGKTHLASAIIKEYGGKYRTAPEIVEELRRAKSFSANETEAQIIDYYGHVALLVVDEIGRGINATDEKYMIYQVLNARYNTRRPTVLISNLNKSEFLSYIGVAAADRLVESATVTEINGESYRRELRGQK